MNNIVLIGFMGCGKTRVARELKKLLRWETVDLDELIERAAGKSIPQIFEEDGEETFRQLEMDACKAFSEPKGVILSVGGGTVLRPENVDALAQGGVLFFLDVDFSVLYPRIKDSDRPLVQNASQDALEALFWERRPIYQAAADYQIPAGKPPWAVAMDLLMEAGFRIAIKKEN